MPEPIDTAASRRSRWRFTIRHLFIVVGLIAAGLAAYRELPDLIRRRFLNDPIPLHVSDKTKIHVRQIPYQPSGQFTYRVHIPLFERPNPPLSEYYYVCAGATKDGETFPEECKVIDIHSSMSLAGKLTEKRISGLVITDDPRSHEKRLIVSVSDGVSSAVPINILIPSDDVNRWTIVNDLGMSKTETFDSDEKVILYRQFWSKEDEPALHRRDADEPGYGVIVWIQRGRPKSKKSQ